MFIEAVYKDGARSAIFSLDETLFLSQSEGSKGANPLLQGEVMDKKSREERPLARLLKHAGLDATALANIGEEWKIEIISSDQTKTEIRRLTHIAAGLYANGTPRLEVKVHPNTFEQGNRIFSGMLVPSDAPGVWTVHDSRGFPTLLTCRLLEVVDSVTL